MPDKRIKWTTSLWIAKAKIIHGSTYDYSKSIFTGTQNKIEIVCPVHGEFWQNAGSHLHGVGCRKCFNSRISEIIRSSTSEFIKKALAVHGRKYDYSKVDYKSANTKVQIICPKHGSFWQKPAYHLSGNGCTACGYEKNAKLSSMGIDNFTNQAKIYHSNKYDYSQAIYIDALTPIRIICPKHGFFYQRPSDHLKGCGCPKCAHRISKWEIEISTFIKTLGIIDIETPGKRILQVGLWGNDQKDIDIYIPSLKMGFECNGLHFHCRKYSSYHADKSSLAKRQGINLYHLWDNVDIELNKSVVASKLKKGCKIIYARKTRTIKISCTTANNFYATNHLQGPVGSSSIHWGLLYENELVNCMSFRKRNKEVIELSRFASKRFTVVVGGFSKLLKRFIDTSNGKYKKLISFACRDICPDPENTIYMKQGFKLSKRKPSVGMSYFDDYNAILHNRQAFMKHKLQKIWDDFDPELSERENCVRHRIFPVYNSGVWSFYKDLC
jgi:ribosomal protein L37E